jgi:hypothetical protein
MTKAFRHILFISIFLAFSAGMSAQDLPTLSQQAGITSGRFANGLSYYIVPNQSSKGYANFALVQKGIDNQEDARSALGYEFLASKGVGYTRDGYISYAGGAAIFNFKDVPSFQSVALDSTVILIFNLIQNFKGEQAIVACGDLDAARLKDRLYMMSLTVSKRTPAPEKEPYVWAPSDRARFIQYNNGCRDLAEIRVVYSTSRTPQKYMSTPQPLVTEMFARQLGYIVRKRIEALFEEKDIPLGYLRFSYTDTAHTDSDEQYSFLAGVSEKDVAAATALISGVLADIDRNGVSADEFLDAKARFRTWAKKTSNAGMTNEEYVSICTANYLYGASMASKKEIDNFFGGRRISLEQDLSMFNRFVSALIDPRRNLTVRYGTPSDSLDTEALRKIFQDSWKNTPPATAYRVKSADSLSLYYPVDRKMKIKTETTDPQTGGSVWAFNNGMKVVFRKTSDSQVRYAYMVRGGYTEVPGIKEGESAFVGDMLGLYDVCGMDAMQFRNMLEANGITMTCRVGIADMCISGTTPQDKLNLLFRSLLSVQKQRALNQKAFDYYRRSEALRQEDFRFSADGINAVTDSIMCPDFYYPLTKSVEKLTDELPQKAERYFAAQFAKSQDGVIFIEGNLNQYDLQKFLCRIIGGFRGSKSFSVRPKVSYQLRSGWSTYTVAKDDRMVGDGSSANLAMAAERPFTMQNWCAFRIAVEHLRRELVKDMAPMGQYFEIVPELRLLPVERIAVFVNCRPCPSEGLPADVEPADPMEVMNRMREALVRISRTPLSASTLKGLKEALAQEMAGEQSDPDYVMDAFLLRNSEGKDVLSNYSTYLGKVTVQDVSDVIDALERGSKVEYVIK